MNVAGGGPHVGNVYNNQQPLLQPWDQRGSGGRSGGRGGDTNFIYCLEEHGHFSRILQAELKGNLWNLEEKTSGVILQKRSILLEAHCSSAAP